MSEKPVLRPGRIDDAAILAELVNAAGEGLPLYLWQHMASSGETAWDVGRQRAARETGGFSYRNAIMIEREGAPVGTLVGYEIPDVVEPIPADAPPMFVPLLQLENLAPGTWYINVLAVLPAYRRLGLGSELLQLAETLGRTNACRGMSVIVSNANPGARSLYERTGYSEAARRPMVKEGWLNDGTEWVLLTKNLT